MVFEEGQLYSAVTTGDDGAVTVHLDDDHPGANDPAYRGRRNEIAKAALEWQPGTPPPRIDYTDEEQNVWRTVCKEIAPKHRRYAVNEYKEALEQVGLPQNQGAAGGSPPPQTRRPRPGGDPPQVTPPPGGDLLPPPRPPPRARFLRLPG